MSHFLIELFLFTHLVYFIVSIICKFLDIPILYFELLSLAAKVAGINYTRFLIFQRLCEQFLIKLLSQICKTDKHLSMIIKENCTK